MNARPLLTCLLALGAQASFANETLSQSLTTKRIASGLNRPLWAGAPSGDDRIFIAEKRGLIRIHENGALRPDPFLNIIAQVNSTASERGLLGMVFHPGYASNGFFFLNYTNATGNTIVSRWKVSDTNANVADPTSEVVVLNLPQPAANHNAGAVLFDQSGYLMIPLGDGGGSNDPNCRAQDPMDLLGKLLRIDVSSLPYSIPDSNPFVDNPAFLPEIYHVGLRNPFRASVDRLTGDLFIGDVGQGNREEISFAAAGVGGLNFGWKILEGTRCNSSAGCPPATPGCASAAYSSPIRELTHSGFNGPLSIIGGYVYRGCAIPGLEGTYFFADWNDNRIRSMRYDPLTGTVTEFTDRTAELAPGGGLSIQSIASFGEDGFGELLIVEHRNPGGEVYKIVEASSVLATSTTRNGSGVNQLCYASQSKPIGGNLLRASVSAAAHPGATMATIVAYNNPSSGTFFQGDEILVDLASGFLFMVSAPVLSGVADFRASIPCDPSMNGLSAATQAFTFGAPPVQLCNALDMTIGGF